MKPITSVYFTAIIILFSTSVKCQLSGNNIFEYQLGNLKDYVPADLSTHYDQLNLNYRYNWLRAEIRYEQFISQTDGSSYNKLSQYRLQYRKGGIDLKVGNFNEILGNGLLLRTFEIPGSVFEEQAYRVRYGFYRDIRGVAVAYNGNIGYVKALRGRTLANTIPPVINESERRPDLSEGLETGINFLGQKAGVVFMRNSNSLLKDSFYSLLLNGNLGPVISYNVEFAHNIKDLASIIRISDVDRYGIYASINYSIQNLGVSIEYKDYNDLLIGAGISDPPTLVKEHKYKVLNRSIHVPVFTDESGWQIEGYYSFSGGSRITLNYSNAINEIISTYTFEEYFAEYNFKGGKKSTYTIFADYSKEPIKFEDNRYATGFIWEYAFGRSSSTLLELEYQSVDRTNLTSTDYQNMALIAGYSNSPKTSVSFIWEFSNDQLVSGGEQIRNWYGLDMSYKINPSNTISIFAGQRRGGPACTSGVCYETLDFQGVEFRFRTKF